MQIAESMMGLPKAEELVRMATAFRVTPHLTIERRGELDEDRWAIVRRSGSNLARDFEFEYEPMPSSRDEDFLGRCRYGLEEAFRMVEAYKEHLARKVISALDEARPHLAGWSAVDEAELLAGVRRGDVSASTQAIRTLGSLLDGSWGKERHFAIAHLVNVLREIISEQK